MSDHVTAVCRSAYYQLRQLRTIARSLSDDAAKTLVQAFISCRLDYCNDLLCGISDGLVQRLQSVQNAAAQLVTRAGRREHRPTFYRFIFVEISLVGSGFFVYFGRSRAYKVTDVGANRKRICDFLLASNSNHGHILHHFGVMTAFMCSWPHTYSTLILGVFPLHQIAHVGRQRAHGP